MKWLLEKSARDRNKSRFYFVLFFQSATCFALHDSRVSTVDKKDLHFLKWYFTLKIIWTNLLRPCSTLWTAKCGEAFQKHRGPSFQQSSPRAFAFTASHYQLQVPALTTGAVSGTIPLLVVAGYILAPFPSSHPQEWVYPLRGGKCNLFLLLRLHTFRLLQDFQRLKGKIVKNNKKKSTSNYLKRTNSTILLW